MLKTGLLVLTTPVQQIVLPRITQLLLEAQKHVSKCLYIHMEPPVKGLQTNQELGHYCRAAELFYTCAHTCCENLPLTVLVPPFCKNSFDKKFTTKQLIDVILNDELIPENKIHDIFERRFIQNNQRIPIININSDSLQLGKLNADTSTITRWPQHKKVVMGGTFDRLHDGHKVLLFNAMMVCTEELTIGITDGPMIKNKILWELIESTSVRKQKLEEFLKECDPTLTYKLEEIIDPFGPSIVDPDLTCIVVSQETVRGGQKVNEERSKKGMSTLELHVVEVVDDCKKQVECEEDKVSSSSHRMRVLGTRIHPVQDNPTLPDRPYIVGLTGGIGAGKTSIAERLQKLGAHVINGDRLAHTIYQKDQPAFEKIVQAFGKDIVGDDGEINRRSLGAIVFNNKESLNALNSIVWPEISRIVDNFAEEARETGVEVVVLDAALLVEANWMTKCHELWVVIVPADVAMKRIKLRDGLTDDQALKRISSQMSNSERVEHANIVFSTLWDQEFTSHQVETAWRILQDDLKAKRTPTAGL